MINLYNHVFPLIYGHGRVVIRLRRRTSSLQRYFFIDIIFAGVNGEHKCNERKEEIENHARLSLAVVLWRSSWICGHPPMRGRKRLKTMPVCL